jgi:hypothetical protein
MTIGRSTFSLTESTRPSRHLFSVFYDYPSAEIHTRRFNPFFTSSIFRLFDSPRLTHIHPRSFRSKYHGEFKISWGYHGEFLGHELDTNVSSFLRTNHTDSLLGPLFFGSQESGNSGVSTKMVCVCGVTGTYTTDTCCLWWDHYVPWPLLCFVRERPLHDEVTETWSGVHTKLLWWWHSGFPCLRSSKSDDHIPVHGTCWSGLLVF